MTLNMSEILEEWNQKAIAERKAAYKYVGLRPIKKDRTYHLILSPLAKVDELVERIQNSSQKFLRQSGLESSHPGFTVIPPKRLRDNPSKSEAQKKPRTTLTRTVFDNIPQSKDTMILTYETKSSKYEETKFSETDSVDKELNCYLTNPQKRIIPITIQSPVDKQGIIDAISANRDLTAQQFDLISAELGKQGYLLKSQGLLAKIEKRGEMTRWWGHPVFMTDEVNFLNAYQSSYDFFNDVKALIIKPITVLLLGLKNLLQAVLFTGSGIAHIARGQAGAVAQFDLALQALFKAFAYLVLSRFLIIAYAQGLSMTMRMLLSIPGLMTKAPTVINDMTARGFRTVAGEGMQSLGTSFCSMFSTKPLPENETTHAAASAYVSQNQESQYDVDTVRAARERAFGVSRLL